MDGRNEKEITTWTDDECGCLLSHFVIHLKRSEDCIYVVMGQYAAPPKTFSPASQSVSVSVDSSVQASALNVGDLLLNAASYGTVIFFRKNESEHSFIF